MTCFALTHTFQHIHLYPVSRDNRYALELESDFAVMECDFQQGAERCHCNGGGVADDSVSFLSGDNCFSCSQSVPWHCQFRLGTECATALPFAGIRSCLVCRVLRPAVCRWIKENGSADRCQADS